MHLHYKGYEIFNDSSYYDMIAVRKIGITTWNETHHVTSIEEAKAFVNSILKAGNKTGT